MRLDILYTKNDCETSGFHEYVDIPLTHLELQTKFGFGNPIGSPHSSLEWQNFCRWLINNYVPSAHKILSVIYL